MSNDKKLRVSRFVLEQSRADTVADEWRKADATDVVVSSVKRRGQTLYRIIGHMDLCEFAKWTAHEARRDIKSGGPWSVVSADSEFGGTPT